MIRTLLITAVTAASLSMVNTASAQYMPPPMGTPSPTGGSGSAATSGSRSYGVNKGALAAVVIGGGVAGGALLLRHLHHQAMTACVGSDGTTLDDGKNIYTVLGTPLTPGERVVASGKKVKSDSGAPAFEVTSLRKNLGRCEQRQQTTASIQK